MTVGAVYCSACGRRVGAPSPHPDRVEALADEASRAARDMVRAAAKFSRLAIDKAEQAARDPPGTAKRAVDRAVAELKNAKAEIDKALKDLE
ncbi:MAG: hypothetical protein L3K19_09005 [Thermoplasmata archaeon]|nr:hypothetical protein [Thermoplasmata archaeon]